MKSLNDVHARAEDDVLAVVRPAHDDVVRPHAVGDVVAAERRGVGQPLGLAALGGHDVDLGVAVVLAGEGELLAVGREAGEHLEAVVAGQPAGDAARRRDGVQVAGVGEDDAVAVDGGEAQQPGLVGGLRRRRPRGDEEQQDGQTMAHKRMTQGVRSESRGVRMG